MEKLCICEGKLCNSKLTQPKYDLKYLIVI